MHEACHAVVAYRTRQHMEIDIATIEKGSDYLGMVASIPPEDQFTQWRSEYETDILVSLASLAGERMFFDGDSSSGVSGDLESATTVASFMEGFWGMGSTVSSYSTAKRLEVGSPGGGQGGRKKKGQDPEAELRRALADRIEDNLGDAAGAGRGAAHARTGARCCAWRTRWRRTRRSPATTCVAVIEHRQGPLIDGRPYADAAFVQRLEEYHRGAAAAHREHSKAPLSMPAAPKPIWDSVGVAATPITPATPNGPTPNGAGAERAEPGPAGLLTRAIWA